MGACARRMIIWWEPQHGLAEALQAESIDEFDKKFLTACLTNRNDAALPRPWPQSCPRGFKAGRRSRFESSGQTE